MSSDGYISDTETMLEEGQTDLENLVRTKHKLDEVMTDLYKIGKQMNHKMEIERIRTTEQSKYLKKAKEAREKQNEKLERLREDHNQEKRYMINAEKDRLELMIKLVIDNYPYCKESDIRKKLRIYDGACLGKCKNGKPCPNRGINDESLDKRQQGFCKQCRPSIECKATIKTKRRNEIADIINGEEVRPYNATSKELKEQHALRMERESSTISPQLQSLFSHII